MFSEKAPLLPVSSSSSEKPASLQDFKGPDQPKHQDFVLVVHGGAGTMDRARSTPAQRRLYRSVLADALRAGHAVLERGGEAMDAVVEAVSVMENCPLFNSGKGAVFNVAGKNELETSLMLSRPPTTHPHIPASRRGQSATLLTRTKNPSSLVRALYLAPELVDHPFLSGEAVEKLGEEQLGVETVDPSYFYTEARWREHRRGLGLPEEPLPAGHVPAEESSLEENGTKTTFPLLDLMPTGTVGAVALDSRGALAALTSTGGKTNKLVGRIGDTPHMGAGFWAEEWPVTGTLRRTLYSVIGKPLVGGVAISGTGDGDYFIRRNAAAGIAHRMQYLGESVGKASQVVVSDLLENGGLGGVICVDAHGNVAMPLNCSGMYRGVIRPDGVPKTAIFDDEEIEEL